MVKTVGKAKIQHKRNQVWATWEKNERSTEVEEALAGVWYAARVWYLKDRGKNMEGSEWRAEKVTALSSVYQLSVLKFCMQVKYTVKCQQFLSECSTIQIVVSSVFMPSRQWPTVKTLNAVGSEGAVAGKQTYSSSTVQSESKCCLVAL